jgi:hypothetical protein
MSTPAPTLADFAHARTGDKGNRINISVIAYDAAHFEWLVQQVTPERVRQHFAHRQPTQVQRYLLPQLAAMNFVLDDVLDGGVNDSLNLDMHGKALSFHLLTLPLTPEVAADPSGIPSDCPAT